jgi:hypothetical protein
MGASRACTYPGIVFTDASPCFTRNAKLKKKSKPDQSRQHVMKIYCKPNSVQKF